MIIGRLGYNSENKRYGLLVSDLWEHSGFHCGEGLGYGRWKLGANKNGDGNRPHVVSGRNTVLWRS
jgi:hypothetical protein